MKKRRKYYFRKRRSDHYSLPPPSSYHKYRPPARYSLDLIQKHSRPHKPLNRFAQWNLLLFLVCLIPTLLFIPLFLYITASLVTITENLQIIVDNITQILIPLGILLLIVVIIWFFLKD